MKALIYKGPKDLRLEEIKKPVPGDDDVLIEVKACGICGSDIHGFLGSTGRRIPPMVMGHEFTGRVAGKGKNVNNFQEGDRVVVYPIIFCGNCEFCKSNRVKLCPNKGMFGVMSINGAMTEYISVPSKLLLKLPEEISFLEGALIEPIAVASSAVNKLVPPNQIRGNNILVIGAGTIGLLLLQIIKDQRPQKLIVSDISNKRLQIAKKLGADVVNPLEEDIDAEIKNKTNNEGIDISFEAVGLSQTVNQAMNALKKNGVSIWVGNSKKIIEIDMQRVVTNELNVIGSYAYNIEDFETAIDLLKNKKIKPDLIISKTVPLSDGASIFNDLADGNDEIIKAVIMN